MNCTVSSIPVNSEIMWTFLFHIITSVTAAEAFPRSDCANEMIFKYKVRWGLCGTGIAKGMLFSFVNKKIGVY